MPLSLSAKSNTLPIPPIKTQTSLFDPHKHYYVVIEFNISTRMGRDFETFSTTTTLKNSTYLVAPLEALYNAYTEHVGNHSLIIHRNDTHGGGRIELRQGSLLLLVRFGVSREGEIIENDPEHSIGKLLTWVGFGKKGGEKFIISNMTFNDEKNVFLSRNAHL